MMHWGISPTVLKQPPQKNSLKTGAHHTQTNEINLCDGVIIYLYSVKKELQDELNFSFWNWI